MRRDAPVGLLHRVGEAELVLEEGKLLPQPLRSLAVVGASGFVDEAGHAEEKGRHL